jgi:hypothetical protein
MSGARTVWQDLETRRSIAMNRQRAGIALAVVLLCAMAAAQVLFVHVAAPTQAAEAMPMME